MSSKCVGSLLERKSRLMNVRKDGEPHTGSQESRHHRQGCMERSSYPQHHHSTLEKGSHIPHREEDKVRNTPLG